MDKKKKLSKLTKYVIFSISAVVVFTIIMLVYYAIYQSIPDTLCTCFYGTFGGELLCSCLIKLFNIKKEVE